MHPTSLRCEYQSLPLGIDVERPRLSWCLSGDHRGARQSAYQILAAETAEDVLAGRGVLWDSGKVLSDQSTHIVYEGDALRSGQRIWWCVRVWDERGEESMSSPHWWEMGLLSRTDWIARWISAPKIKDVTYKLLAGPEWQNFATPEDQLAHWMKLRQASLEAAQPSPYFRKPFTVTKQVVRARVYATARGLYKLYVNGVAIGYDYFRPGWTDYHARIQYQTYDIASLLKPDENVLGVILGEGWYSGAVSWQAQRNNYGDTMQALVQVVLDYDDGSQEMIASDSSWRCAYGPILSSDFLMGEVYDARQEVPGWSEPDFVAETWQAVQETPLDDVRLVAQCGPTVQKIMELPPVAMTEPQPDTYIFDLGQNMVGWVRLCAKGPAGTTVQLRFAEMLNPDGTMYVANLRTAKSTELYTLKGSEEEEAYEPSFTFHGFRYVEVTGYPGEPDLHAVTGVVVGSHTPRSGSFECSHPMVNQLQKNIEWGQRGNFLEVPTDCPQRDERLGWTGDAQIFIRTATYNANVAAFFTKWLNDMEDAQLEEGCIPNVIPRLHEKVDAAPGWADAMVVVPWTLYEVYGDTRVLEQHYAMIKRWMDHLHRLNPTHLWRTHRNGSGDGKWDFGDWLSIDADTPKDVLADAFFAQSTKLMAYIAEALNRQEDAQHYHALFTQVKQAFNAEYVQDDGSITGNTQTVYVLALSFDLLPEQLRPLAARHLVEDIERHNGHLSTGFLGVGHLMPALTEAGYADVAYRLLLNDTFPSWGYSIKHGATTIWERWDGWTAEKGFQDVGMNSFNHYSLGSVGEWLYRYVAGIDTTSGLKSGETGYRHCVLRPYPQEQLRYVRAMFDSMHGRIVSHWRKEPGAFIWDVTIPANTIATIYVPASEQAHITESGQPATGAEGIISSRREEGFTAFEAVSGTSPFEFVV